jgi:hypothetical protein
MSSANPLPRSARRNDIAAAIGQTVFGPFDWKVYATADVAVKTRAASATFFTDLDSGFTVALTDETLPSFFTVTFAAAPRAAAPEVTVRIQGARIHERETDVTQGGAVRAAPLEAELDRQTVAMQELRRDADDAAAPDALDTAIAAAVASGTAIAVQAAADAGAARDEAIEVTDGLQESVDAALTQVNATLAAATLAKNDAQAAAIVTTADRAQIGADVITTAGLVAAAEGYADALANPDYGFFTDAPSETRDYGSFT